MDYAIIVAGGKGTRMGASIPKQFLPLNGLPVLMQTIKRFREYSHDLEIILVLPKEQHEYWYELCKKHRFTTAYTVADGGETRFQSVKNGLSMIPDDAEGVVGIHDGVRPFPSCRDINPHRRQRQARTCTERQLPAGADTADIRHTAAQTRLHTALPRQLYGRRFGRGQHRTEDNPYRRKPRKHKNHHAVRPPHGAHSCLTAVRNAP